MLWIFGNQLKKTPNSKIATITLLLLFKRTGNYLQTIKLQQLDYD